jgi:phospholipase C
VFRPYNGEKITLPEFLERDAFIESIHKAQFKQLPSNFKKLTTEEIEAINKAPWSSPNMPQQEKGIRNACALPYELFADGGLTADKSGVQITLMAANVVFKQRAAGSPFHIYAPGKYQQQVHRNWAYAVEAGKDITANWKLSDFENNSYHLQVYGPNGFFRELKGTKDDAAVNLVCDYETDALRNDLLTGNIIMRFINTGTQPLVLEIADNAYKTPAQTVTVKPGKAKIHKQISVNTAKSYGWYDFSVKLKGNQQFERRYAGRVETGKPTKTDPFMGRVVQ